MPTNAPLQGLTLVVTRPRAQAEPTAQLLRAAGAEVILFPVLAIDVLAPTLEAPQIAGANAVIFVSANAVEYGMPWIAKAGGVAPQTKLFAIGEATAEALRKAGAIQVITPLLSADSEGLLALPQLHAVDGHTVILVKGVSDDGGRTLLADTLAARGARILSLECYSRASIQAPATDRQALAARLDRNEVHGFFALSVETLQSLANNLTNRVNWPRVTLLVPHPRVAAEATRKGFGAVHIVPMAGTALVEALARLKPQLMTQHH
jgi:uroporphyrinogen-III synthase